MNKTQREPYCILTNIELPNGNQPFMCSFCRYSEWNGDCKEPESWCEHPLFKSKYCRLEVEDEVNDALQGCDCWLFRPYFSPDIAVDIVGFWLQGKRPDWDTVPILGKIKEA